MLSSLYKSVNEFDEQRRDCERTEHGAITDSEELGLVVPSDRGISIAISWEERQLFGQVGCHFFLFQRYSFYYIKFLNFICLSFK